MADPNVIQLISFQSEAAFSVSVFVWTGVKDCIASTAHGSVLLVSIALLDRGRQMLGKMHPEMADIPEEDLYMSIGNCIVVVAAHACDGTVSSENRCLVGNAVAWLVGNVNGNGSDTIPLHAVGFEGYLDGGLKWFVILIAMVGLSQYMQPSKEFYWRAIVCKAQYFVCMIGRSNVSHVARCKVNPSDAFVISYDMNVFAHVLISGFFEVNRRVKLQLLSIAFEDKHGCLASAKALHLLLGCWSVPLIVQADDHASQIKSSCSICLWTGSKSSAQIIPRSVADKRKCDRIEHLVAYLYGVVRAK
jgi:hypothetical protein